MSLPHCPGKTRNASPSFLVACGGAPFRETPLTMGAELEPGEDSLWPLCGQKTGAWADMLKRRERGYL
jgi:hypothetical protein